MDILLYLGNTICYAGQSSAGKLYAAKKGETHIFNFSKALSAMVLFLVFCIIKKSTFHWVTGIYGFVYGLTLMASMHFGLLALGAGPMALTSMLAAMSLMIPLLWGLLFWNETLSLPSIFGLFLLLAAITLICSPKKAKLSKKWLFYCLLTLICNGICSVIQKYHQQAFPGKYQAEFMLYGMTAVTAVLFAIQIAKRRYLPKPNILGTASGIMNGLANFIVLLLAATENATQLFPLVSAANIMAAYLSGLFFFREKISLIQIIGLVTGSAGIIFLKL